MYRIYRAIKTAVANLYYWMLDYGYVTYWQVFGLLKRYDAKRYIEVNSHRDPIILIPGIYERWHFMKPIAELLHSRGYSVHVVESLGYNTGATEEMAMRVQEYVRSNQIERYSIVAHSKGGLVAKYLLGVDGGAIHSVIAINTPFRGSKYAGLFPFKSIRLFLPSSALIVLLAQDIQSNKKITSIYSTFDPHIPGGSYLEGASNIQLESNGHFRSIKDSRLHTHVVRSLNSDR